VFSETKNSVLAPKIIVFLKNKNSVLGTKFSLHKIKTNNVFTNIFIMFLITTKLTKNIQNSTCLTLTQKVFFAL